jgi:hypothetical protein
MKHTSIAIALAAAFVGTPAFADKGSSCHFHGSAPAKEETVLTCAAQRKDALVASGKLEASWKRIQHDKVEQVDGKKGKEWKVTFTNPAVADKAKQTLYVFLSAPGNVLAANFTGK